jgi:hypothetical protein
MSIDSFVVILDTLLRLIINTKADIHMNIILIIT